jgi:hypothetical protein
MKGCLPTAAESTQANPNRKAVASLPVQAADFADNGRSAGIPAGSMHRIAGKPGRSYIGASLLHSFLLRPAARLHAIGPGARTVSLQVGAIDHDFAEHGLRR